MYTVILIIFCSFGPTMPSIHSFEHLRHGFSLLLSLSHSAPSTPDNTDPETKTVRLASPLPLQGRRSRYGSHGSSHTSFQAIVKKIKRNHSAK